MAYDASDRLTGTNQTLPNGFSASISYSYDPNGNRTGMTTPWGGFTYTYDQLDRVRSITNPQGRTFNFTYDALGRRTSLTYPNGVEAVYAYDAASQLTSVLNRKISDNSAVSLAQYSYDAAGNRTSMGDFSGNHTYGYDNLHRLTSANHPPLSHVDTINETFAYDAVGNRTSDASGTSFSYDNANRLMGDPTYTYTYDANGNMIEGFGKLLQLPCGSSRESHQSRFQNRRKHQ